MPKSQNFLQKPGIGKPWWFSGQTNATYDYFIFFLPRKMLVLWDLIKTHVGFIGINTNKNEVVLFVGVLPS